MTQHEQDAALDGLPAAADDLSGDQVVEYLRNNPKFLAENADLLSTMESPGRWSGDGVVDMQQFLMENLRAEIDNLRESARFVIELSRNNMSIQSRCHAAVLALLAADTADQFFHIISDDLPLLLDVDVVTLGFEPSQPPLAGLVSPEILTLNEGTVDHWMAGGRNACLVREIDDDGALFGAAAGLVHSAALARIRPGKTLPAGLLALGSRTPGLFEPGQGTELIAFLARIMEWSLSRWLEKPT